MLHRNRLGGGGELKARIKLRSPSIPMVPRWFEHCFEELNALSGVIEIPEEIMAVRGRLPFELSSQINVRSGLPKSGKVKQGSG